jgi:chorismate dehydratase
VAAVSYLNTKPLLYGIKQHEIIHDIVLTEDYPAKIAQLLIDDKVDVGLIPVAATRKLKDWHIIGDYCIGCEGPVASVCLFSEEPIENIDTVILDYQSRTSVNLAKILMKEYWMKKANFIDATGEDFRHAIKGKTAGVIIGDRALEQRQHSKFIYDLGEAWIDHTQLPFVFAAWISNKPLPKEFEEKFNDANSKGLAHIEEVVKMHPYPVFDLKTYFTQSISYTLTAKKKQGLALFLQKLECYQL